MLHRHLRITGRVQGVAYRDWMVAEARALGVAGWVRNRADGSVEAVVAGPEEAVAALVARAGDGPAQARVARVAAADAPPEPYDGFTRRPTA